jgi:hypothetical protein
MTASGDSTNEKAGDATAAAPGATPARNLLLMAA